MRGSDDYGGSVDFYSLHTVHLHLIIFYAIKYIAYCGAMDFAISLDDYHLFSTELKQPTQQLIDGTK